MTLLVVEAVMSTFPCVPWCACVYVCMHVCWEKKEEEGGERRSAKGWIAEGGRRREEGRVG